MVGGRDGCRRLAWIRSVVIATRHESNREHRPDDPTSPRYAPHNPIILSPDLETARSHAERRAPRQDRRVQPSRPPLRQQLEARQHTQLIVPDASRADRCRRVRRGAVQIERDPRIRAAPQRAVPPEAEDPALAPGGYDETRRRPIAQPAPTRVACDNSGPTVHPGSSSVAI